MDFEWLNTTRVQTDGTEKRAQVAAQELANRAGTLFRLGFSQADATKRLCARVAWEHEAHGGQQRHASLSDEAVAKIVSDTYARRPGW